MIKSILDTRRNRHRSAIIAYLRGNDWCTTYNMWRHLRISSGQLHSTLQQLKNDNIVEVRWQTQDEQSDNDIRRRLYRLRDTEQDANKTT